MEQSFKIITPVYNAEAWIGKCIESVKAQDHSNWHQIIIDDNSMDRTVERAKEAIGDDERFTLISNEKRIGVPLNHKKGVEASEANQEDIMVHLDGDDWFFDQTSLSKVAAVYDKTKCWMTYGSYMTTTDEKVVARKYTGHPRQAVLDGWPFSHLRTFKRHLWNILNESDFKGRDGEYYTAAADVVIFVPILEQIGYDKVEFITDILLVYNLTTNNNEHKQNYSAQVGNALDVIQK
jgi:glycosyltransferase involved in cell wall biosynthesis